LARAAASCITSVKIALSASESCDHTFFETIVLRWSTMWPVLLIGLGVVLLARRSGWGQ